jgi:hypothetical protein
MGFSLKYFFEALELLINDETRSDESKIELLKDLVTDQKEYARICNQL